MAAASAGLAMIVPAVCADLPGDAMLRPPAQMGRALSELGEQTVRSTRRLATRAQRESDRLVRRSAPVTGPVLARAIRHAEAQAARAGAKPIPPAIAQALAPYFGSDILSSVRWTTGRGRVDLGTILTRRYMREGAVALNRQVVFSSERLTRNIWMWAHELAHVEQYRRMGVNGFATAYIANWQAIEREANDRADRVTAAIRKAG